ncbi:hypothetical protein B0J13DRAFT_618815 [Dactylonectria estremocensis]|uniref:FAD-binding domain-containing protein n=1 Tax=Dactylonectria estremocensis TaxID=1079267 RepID=A0A9P9JCV0_9HYPO|nr:hypothetical protein B0J13DRAFT_618815 [Dactylonectria estremocensis]
MGFKIIIVGGGPVGLTLAHALTTIARVDVTVLESRTDVFEDAGASLILSPPSLRIFQQLGLLDAILEIGAPLLHHSQSFDATRSSFKRGNAMHRLHTNLGCGLMALHRADLIRLLYGELPDATKRCIHTGKRLVDILVTSIGVEAICADGTSYWGSLVIGADGAHSKTRSIMRRHALESDSGLASIWDAESPFTSHYKCLWASFPRLSDSGDSYETQGQHRSTMYLTGRDKGWLFLYEKLPCASKDRNRYDTKSMESFAHTFAQWSVTETLKVKDVLDGGPDTVIVGMTDLEEGVAKRIAWGGRIVLVGDAAHKFTPNAGAGFNNGVQDVASLYNQLESLRDLNANSIQTAFEMYQQERQVALERDFRRSAGATRLSAWETWSDFLLARFFYSIGAVQRYYSDRNSEAMTEGLVLNSVAADEPFLGKLAWKHELRGKRES